MKWRPLNRGGTDHPAVAERGQVFVGELTGTAAGGREIRIEERALELIE